MAKYPVIEVGDPWTADLANAMLPDITYKSTTTTRASTTTVADDPDLVTPTLVANGTYVVEFSIRYGCLDATVGFKTTWNVPVGVLSANKDVVGAGSASSEGNSNNVFGRFGVHGYATSVQYGSRGSVGNQVHAVETSTVIMGATAGTIALQWAQATSSATGSTLNSGSYVKVTRTG
jgi:hypothetical protein